MKGSDTIGWNVRRPDELIYHARIFVWLHFFSLEIDLDIIIITSYTPSKQNCI